MFCVATWLPWKNSLIIEPRVVMVLKLLPLSRSKSALCQLVRSQECTKCQLVTYCGREYQKLDRKTH